MDYTQFFRRLRETKNLTLEELASLARVHRNTVVNIESGRPVKFKTIAALMRKMGFSDNSPEMKSIALLWLEAVSGISLSRSGQETAARKTIASLRAGSRHAARSLDQAIADENLTASQIELLTFAARNPSVLSIIETVRDFAAGSRESGSVLPLKAAEDPGSYGNR